MKAEFMYDSRSDDLYIYGAQKSHGSIELGENIIIDFDANMNVVALEFLDASKALGYLTGKRITKKFLKTIKNAGFYSERKGGLSFTFFKIVFADNKSISEKLTMQDLKYKSPVLAR